MRLFLFTDAFPHGLSETFLENELPFLSDKFEKVILIPLYKKEGIRSIPENINTWNPIINFNPSNKLSMLKYGLFNLAPIRFEIKEFFQKKVYLNKNWVWNFFTSLLLFRSIYSNSNLWKKFLNEITFEDKIYFYWGDKSILILPFLKNKINNTTYVRFHRTDLYEYAKGDYIPFRKYVFPSINWFLPISNDGKKYLIENYLDLINPDKIHIHRLGVLNNGINPLKNKTDIFQIVSCSYMVPVKRISLIIDALKLIDFEIKWTHIGTGNLYESLKKSSELLPSNIHVELSGSLSNKEVINFYQLHHVDLFINVSSSEGVPVSIMEALSFGIPVIATDVGGTSEIIDKQVGKLLKSNSEACEIAKTISDFANQDLSEMRYNARRRWNDTSYAKTNYLKFVEFINISN